MRDKRQVFALVLFALLLLSSACVCYSVDRDDFPFHVPFVPFFGLFGLLGTAFWVWTLIEVVTKEPEGAPEKTTWLLVVILAGVVGAILYWVIRRPKRVGRTG